MGRFELRLYSGAENTGMGLRVEHPGHLTMSQNVKCSWKYNECTIISSCNIQKEVLFRMNHDCACWTLR